MKKFLLVAGLLLLSGCIGTFNGNPYTTRRAATQPWWQASTAGVTSNNPWNKFIHTPEGLDTSDPWANFVEPDLFPKNFAPRAQKKNIQRLDERKMRSIIPNREVY